MEFSIYSNLAGDFKSSFLLCLQLDTIVVELSWKTPHYAINKMADIAGGKKKNEHFAIQKKHLSLIWFLNRNCKNVKMILHGDV